MKAAKLNLPLFEAFEQSSSGGLTDSQVVNQVDTREADETSHDPEDEREPSKDQFAICLLPQVAVLLHRVVHRIVRILNIHDSDVLAIIIGVRTGSL